MRYTRRFQFPAGPDEARPRRNWHPYVGIPAALLGAMGLVMPDLFSMSFLAGGLAVLLWWLGTCYARSDLWRLILWWLVQGLALVTLVCWAVLAVRQLPRLL